MTEESGPSNPSQSAATSETGDIVTFTFPSNSNSAAPGLDNPARVPGTAAPTEPASHAHTNPTPDGSPTIHGNPVTNANPASQARPASGVQQAASSGSTDIPELPSMAKSWEQVKKSQVVQQGTVISKQYFAYYLKALMNPFGTAATLDKSHFTNGIITMVLTSLLLPLAFYLTSLRNPFFHLPFIGGVIKPFILILIALLLASAIAFGLIRLARVASDYRSVTTKLGTLLVPATAALALCNLSIILQFSPNVSLFFFSLALTFIFTAIIAVVIGSRKESGGGLDPLYGAVIASIAFGYILFKFADFGIDALMGGLL
ncbi:hypothetical protein [Paenibacillus sp. A14]|uniref:hypothetical protein n=1 Tax=Paenibacillus sp. A14 TaxID=3119820 RepID=UPI002FE0C8A2